MKPENLPRMRWSVAVTDSLAPPRRVLTVRKLLATGEEQVTYRSEWPQGSPTAGQIEDACAYVSRSLSEDLLVVFGIQGVLRV